MTLGRGNFLSASYLHIYKVEEDRAKEFGGPADLLPPRQSILLPPPLGQPKLTAPHRVALRLRTFLV